MEADLTHWRTIADQIALGLPGRASREAAGRSLREAAAEVERLRARVAELEDDSTFLEALSAAGVDNWDGYSHAHDIFREWQDGGETDGG